MRQPRAVVDRDHARGVVLLFGALVFAAGAAAAMWLGHLRDVDAQVSEARTAAYEDELLQERIRGLEKNLGTFAASPGLKAAFDGLSDGYDAHIPSHLRDMYVDLNEYSGTDRALLVDPEDGSKYSHAHSRSHEWLRGYNEFNGFNDTYLVRADGEVIYSVEKGRVFARTVERDAPAEFQAVFGQALGRSSAGGLAVSPERGDLMGAGVFYAAAPVVARDGSRLGVVVVEQPSWEEAGLGATALSVLQRETDLATTLGAAFTLAILLSFGGLMWVGSGTRVERRTIRRVQVLSHASPAAEGETAPDSARSQTLPIHPSRRPLVRRAL